ncbi:MAG: glycosyltransferase family 2 protein [Nitrospirae bacterium]|nr:glycosyltransferase family 2 protein [Nitrospirota bacterium]MBF0533811.1 glycosyltransferase family 2 protein [Nitrospirota bacterium]MBF0615480.1 glycosyltransferase family 2 protein [Nitrospirota bacterium]
MLKNITVIIPNYNGLVYLGDCLNSLRNQTYKSFETIVVDNGSTDGSVDFIKENFPEIRLISFNENTGFSHACNAAIKASESPFIALLNNDTEVSPQWLSALFEVMNSEEETGMVASKILLDKTTIDSTGMLIYPDGIGRQRGRGETDAGQYDDRTEILYPSGCACLIRRKMLDDIGLLDEDFFAYCEDVDLGLRCRIAGWGAVYSPDAVVYHKYSETGGKYSLFKAFLVERNRIWVAVKNFPLEFIIGSPFYTFKRYLYQAYSIITKRGSTARFAEGASASAMVLMFLKAYGVAILKIPLMLTKRFFIKKRISASEFSRLLKKHEVSASELILKD